MNKINWNLLKIYIENNSSFIKPQQYSIINCYNPKNKCGQYINKDFFDNLKNPYNSIFEKFYYFIYAKISNTFNTIRNFILNVFDFRKELSTFTEYDFEDSLMMFKKGLELMLKQYNKINVDWEDKDKQKKYLQDIFKLINRMSKGYDHYYNLAEKICGKYYDIRKKEELSKKLFEKDKNKLFLLWDYIYQIWI